MPRPALQRAFSRCLDAARASISSPRRLAVLAVFLVAVVLRATGWPYTPAGLNQDELSAAYEAHALLLHGTDRWGAAWPAYFASWGSGQNVLYSYLSIPFVAVFGLTAAGVRAVQLVTGILTVALAHQVAERSKRGAGIWAMLLFALSPWHFMMSRWGLESNLLPFCMVLGLATLGSALEGNRRLIPVSLLPFVLGLYAYGIFLVPFMAFGVLTLVRYRGVLKLDRARWIVASLAAAVLAVPFALFVLKSYVVKHDLPGEQWLFFSLPDLNATRLDQLSSGVSPVRSNIQLLANGFNDGAIWNSLPGFAPIASWAILAAAFVLLGRIVFAVAHRTFSPIGLPELLFASSLTVVFLIPLDLNQANSIATATLLLAAVAVRTAVVAARGRLARTTVAVLVAAVIAVPGAWAFHYYMSYSFAVESDGNYNPGFQAALQRAVGLGDGMPIYVSQNVALNYVQTLFYQRVDPTVFQASHPTFSSYDFEDFKFSQADVTSDSRFAFAARSYEDLQCTRISNLVVADGFSSGVCTRGG